MPRDEEVTRRIFLERLAAGAFLGAVGARSKPALAASSPGPWTPPPVLKNPNILVIIVDQLRPATYWPSGQSLQTVLPNIVGKIQSNSYNFDQFFVAATACTASRACLLTGLYAPQTAMYINCDPGATQAPYLNPAFPTWGQALTTLNPAYQGNLWWFGKWHLSEDTGKQPLQSYGFNTSMYPGGTLSSLDPIGVVNEGTDGGSITVSGEAEVWPNDSMIANDFVNWIGGYAAAGKPSSPWCATVSLVNPHDICGAPAWFNAYPATGVTAQPISFPPPAPSTPPSYYTSEPNGWNFENPATANKPALQSWYVDYLNQTCGAVSGSTGSTGWINYLNLYLWLQHYVDAQVGAVWNALQQSPYASNTIVIFLSDHGEFGGSHGIRLKGFAVYDEAINVPFYVQFPGQTGTTALNQMCSGVDFFGFMCDLVTGGSGQWRLAYPDLSNRQSMWSFLYNNTAETRVAPSIGLPYIFHTFDANPATGTPNSHIVCMRTSNSAGTGAKLAFYAAWAACTTYPNATALQWEFYNYNPTAEYPNGNTTEMNNDYSSSNPTAVQTLHTQALGVMGPTPTGSTGLIATELNRPLIGIGNGGTPLSQAQAAAQLAYGNYMGTYNSSGSCTDA